MFFFSDRITISLTLHMSFFLFFFCSFFAFIQSASPFIIDLQTSSHVEWHSKVKSTREGAEGKRNKNKKGPCSIFCLVSNEEEEADSVSSPFLYYYVSSFLFIYYRVVRRRTCLFKYTPCLCVCVCVCGYRRFYIR